MRIYGEADMRRAARRDWLRQLLLSKPINAVVVAALSRLPPSRRRSRVPVRRPFAEYRLASGDIVRMLDPHRCSVARNLFWGGGRLPSVADMDAIRMAEALAGEARTFLDIGGYSGLFALVAARANPALRSIGFEIVPTTYLLAVRNAIANDLHDRVDFRLQGISDEAGVLVMPSDLPASSLPTSLSIGSGFASGVHVPLIRLDDLVDAVEGLVAIKIDVEGYEGRLFAGSGAFIARHRPDIICELLKRSTDAPAIEALLAPLGYRFHQFTEQGLVARDRIVPSRDGRDWLFTVRDSLPDVRG